MTTAAPGRFPSFSLGTSSTDNTLQTGNTMYSNSIWGNANGNASASANSNGRNVIGSAYPPKRDTLGSRGSDEASPSAPYGSAQLSHQSEAEPLFSRGSQWPSSQSRTTSGTTSPNQTRDGGLGQHNLQDQYFANHTLIGQSGSAFSNRTKNHSSLNPSSTAFKYTLGDSIGDDKEDHGPYPSLSSSNYGFQPSRNTYKRGSQENTYTIGSIRPNGPAPMGRNSETGIHSSGPSHADLPGYAFDSNLPGSSLNSVSRPGVPHHSTSFPSESYPARGFSLNNSSTDHGLSNLLSQKMRFEEPTEGEATNLTSGGYPGAANETFQLNPVSQAWSESGELSSNGRAFGQGYQQEGFADHISGSNYASKRGSMERGSPAGSAHRPSLNSPRFAPNVNPLRADSWNRPPSRNPPMNADLARQQALAAQYSNQILQANGYYDANFAPQFQTPYDQYLPNGAFQQLPHYSVPLNRIIPGVNAPMRPSKDQDPAKGVRSIKLEEFRASNRSNKRWDLKDIYDHIVEFSGDQHGSRFIQEKLQTANSDEKEQVFSEIQDNAVQLMKDVFGNYVIQKFFEHGSQVQKKIIAAKMKGKVAELSTQMYACRVVQKALEHVLVEQQKEIVAELKPDILRIVKDQNGNHVVQKIISMVPRECLPFMMDAFRGQIHALAAHNFGCRVVQRMLEQGTEAEKKELMAEIHLCSPQLISDQYGNYVAQHIIGHGDPDDRSKMINHVINEILSLSKHKFASNVVEKCIEHGTPDERRAIRAKLTAISADGTSPLQMMMRDQFGNYVIQKMLQQLDGPDRDSFIEEMRPQFNQLKKLGNGRQITALERLIAATAPPTQVGGFKQGTSGRQPTTAPSTPGLQIDVNSVAPTPGLTSEHDSPADSSPPSTNSSTVNGAVGNDRKSKIATPDAQPQVFNPEDIPLH